MADTTLPKTKYYNGIGRRKSASARVRLYESAKDGYIVNGKEASDYFPTEVLVEKSLTPVVKAASSQKFLVSVKVLGGGSSAQAEAIRLGIARALVTYNDTLRSTLKKEGYLKRDPRVKERRKFGLKKARKAAQWSKR